jgi:hypothetical protein
VADEREGHGDDGEREVGLWELIMMFCLEAGMDRGVIKSGWRQKEILVFHLAHRIQIDRAFSPGLGGG